MKGNIVIIKRIEADIKNARLNRYSTTLSILTTLFSEISMVGKNNGNRDTTDAEAVSIIKKFIKDCEFTRKIGEDLDDSARLECLDDELEIYKSYLPQQMDESRIVEIINNLRHSGVGGSMKEVMAYFKENFNGQYDGRTVSSVFNQG